MRNAIFSNYQPGGMFSVIDVDKHPGNVWFVDSGHASKSDSDGYGQNPDAPFSTIDYAIGKLTVNNGDVIYVAPGHTETLSAASTITADVAGASIIGLGAGNDRPKITIGTDAAATITISAASVCLKNIIVIGALDGLNSAITVTGDDCDIDIEYRDTSATVEANIAITATSVDRAKIKLNYIGFIAGNAVTNAIVLDGCTSCNAEVAFYGVASTAIVEFTGNACHNINVKGYFYNSGTSDLSKNVVDTITGSTWAVSGFDGVAGCGFSGGSGAAVAKDDVSAVNALIGTIVNTGGTATLGAILGDFANVTLITKLTTLLGAIINGTGTTLPTNKSLYDKIREFGDGYLVSKEITYDASASYTAFTVTGLVACKVIGYITTPLSNDAATTSVGTATSAAGLIAATAGTAMQTANQVWADNAPSKFEALPTAYSVIGDGEDIAVDGNANLAAGVVTLYCFWKPLSADGNVVAA